MKDYSTEIKAGCLAAIFLGSGLLSAKSALRTDTEAWRQIASSFGLGVQLALGVLFLSIMIRSYFKNNTNE